MSPRLARRLAGAIALAFTPALFHPALFHPALGLTPAAAHSVHAGHERALRPVAGFEVERYLGTWHEIASIPAWFQKQCTNATTATYTAVPEAGQIGVLNGCETADGTRDRAVGRARFTGPADAAALEVSFLSLFGRPLWLISGAYVVIALDPEYRWSAVAHPSRGYAWILAREPELDPATLATIAKAYAAVGYDTCRILTSPRASGEPRVPLCERVAASP